MKKKLAKTSRNPFLLPRWVDRIKSNRGKMRKAGLKRLGWKKKKIDIQMKLGAGFENNDFSWHNRGEHVDFDKRNPSLKATVCADRGGSFDLQSKTRRQVLASTPQLETLKGASHWNERQNHVENAPSLKEGLNKKKKNAGREKKKSTSGDTYQSEVHKPTGSRSCGRRGRKQEAERGRSETNGISKPGSSSKSGS